MFKAVNTSIKPQGGSGATLCAPTALNSHRRRVTSGPHLPAPVIPTAREGGTVLHNSGAREGDRVSWPRCSEQREVRTQRASQGQTVPVAGGEASGVSTR